MSITTITVAIIAFIVLVDLVKLAAKGGRVRVMDYFKSAVKVYLWLEGASALLAALACAKAAASAQRDGMVSHLVQLSSQITQLVDKIPEFRNFQAGLESLAQQIMAKDWTVHDAQKAKNELAEINPRYLEALNRSDPSVFVLRYPALFQASNMSELIEAAEKEKRSELERGVKIMKKLKELKELKEFQDPEVKIILDQSIERAKKDLKQ